MRKSKAAAAAAKRPHHAAQNCHALPSRLARYLDPDASLDKDQLLDAVHWIRQAVGLACGLLWGAVPLVGTFWIALCTDELRWGTERLSCAGADHVQRRSFQRRPGQTDDARLLLLVHVFIDLVLPQGEI